MDESNKLRDTWYHAPSDSDPAVGESVGSSRVPPFNLPALSYRGLSSQINQLRSNNADTSHTTKMRAMDNLLLRQGRRVGVSRIVYNVPESSTGTRLLHGEKGTTSPKDKLRQLGSRSVSLSITYGSRMTPILLNSRCYSLRRGDDYDEREDMWRLYYLDRSQFGIRPWKKQLRRRKNVTQKLGKAETEDPPTSNPQDNGNESRALRLTQGSIAGLFISMAQARERELEFDRLLRGLGSPIRMPPEPQPQMQARYQLLFTDNDKDSTCIYLYTAQVSDLLLDHFNTPAHLPLTALLSHSPHLMKIHRIAISYTPFKSFRRRLRIAIGEYANGTSHGYFGDSSPSTDSQWQMQGGGCLADGE